MSVKQLRLILLASLPLPLMGQVDLWDLPPVRYSDTVSEDPLARMAVEWSEGGGNLAGKSPLEKMRAVLAALNVSEASQVLVFSKTSKQNSLIHPQSPRALFFSMDTYCGYVPGGALEVVVHDRRVGPVFYLVNLGNPDQAPVVERDTSECLSCHATARTEHVPGVMLRSVYPDKEGHAILSLGSGVITHETPVPERWGGYYVTGSISLPHLGNRTYTHARDEEPAIHRLKHLKDKINVSKYPRATSDVVSLMVLEHQCHAHNLLTAASMNYRRARYLAESLNPGEDPDAGSAGRVAEHAAAEIVSWFLFKGEADLGEDGVEGEEEFQDQLQARVPKALDGKSLADFELNTRLFKHRCSYMIYSNAYRDLPEAVKTRVVKGLRSVLESSTAADDYPEMKLSERRRTAGILRETGIF
jgi:hypothetical protein